jgi:thiol:disulfide interchange protein DsbA
MRSFCVALVASLLFATTAFASPTAPQEGVEYTTLKSPQPVTTVGKKIEVIEFFMYHCPHCYAFNPDLEHWVKKQGDKIVFRRMHSPYRSENDPEAHLFLTLDAMGKADDMLPKVFKAVHVDRVRLMQDDAIIDWVGKNGIDRNSFVNTWNSFGVTTKLRRLPQVIDNYKVPFVPTIVIDGKYQTAPSMAETALKSTSEPEIFGATLQIMDALVAKAAAAK